MKALLLTGCLALALAACTAHVQGGGGGSGGDSGAGGGGTCSAPPPGLCSPSLCTGGVMRTGEATCQGGQWVCTVASCGGGTGGSPSCGTIEASSYDQSCASDADCVAVYEGSLCSMCYCPQAAISQSAEAQYQADFAAGHPQTNVCDCANVPAPVCAGGTCTLP